MDIMKRIKVQFNLAMRHQVEADESCFVILQEQAGTFEMANALAHTNTTVTLQRQYEPEELHDFFMAGGHAGLYMKSSEWDLKRFEQVYSKLPSGMITHIYLEEDYPDNISFIKVAEKISASQIPLYCGLMRTVTGIERLVGIASAVMIDNHVFGKNNKQLARRKREFDNMQFIYPHANNEALAYGFDLINVGNWFTGLPMSAGATVIRDDDMLKDFNGQLYYYDKNNDDPAKIHAQIVTELGDDIYHAGHTNINDFKLYTELE